MASSFDPIAFIGRQFTCHKADGTSKSKLFHFKISVFIHVGLWLSESINRSVLCPNNMGRGFSRSSLKKFSRIAPPPTLGRTGTRDWNSGRYPAMHSDRLTILLNSWCYAARCDIVMNIFRRPLEEPFEPAFLIAMCTFNQTLYCIADSLSDM